jgi:hypothetical protein
MALTTTATSATTSSGVLATGDEFGVLLDAHRVYRACGSSSRHRLARGSDRCHARATFARRENAVNSSQKLIG